MLDRNAAEFVFLEHLGFIEKASFIICAKRGIWGDDAEDLVSWIKIKLMENEYERLRRYPGTGQLTTYLAVIVARGVTEYRREHGWQRRTSAGANRLEMLVREVERLVYRDGLAIPHVGKKLRREGRTSLCDKELARLLARHRSRPPLHQEVVRPHPGFVGAEGSSGADDLVPSREEAARHAELVSALHRALTRLDPEDRMIVQMHLSEGYSVYDVARALTLAAKPLFRRVAMLRDGLRAQIESEGLSARDVLALLEMGGFGAPPANLIVDQNEPHDFEHPGILGPDGLPIKAEDLQGSRIITDIVNTTEQLVSMVRNDPNRLQKLTSREFEFLVAELLEEQGYSVNLTPPSKDGGFDMYAAWKDGVGEFMFLVECKRYSLTNPVGVDVVRALFGVVQMKRASAGIVVTTSRFTKGAIEFQKSAPHQLSLRDYLNLQQWLGPHFPQSSSDT